MKQSDLNHLRRLLGWVRCDIGQDPAGQQQTMIDIAGKLGIDSIDADAKARLVEGYRRAEAVPVYVRDAVKALEKALTAVGRDPGVVAPRATAETRANTGFDPGAGAENARLRELLARCQAWMLSSEYDRPNMLIALIQDALQSQPLADKDGGQQRAGDELPALMQSRMTPWGLLVRAGRIILGTTPMDMSKALGMPPSDLSAYECDHQRLTDDVILAVMRFFDERGLCIPATAWRKAARASARAALSATQAGQGERQ